MLIIITIRIKTGNLSGRFPNDDLRASMEFHAFLSFSFHYG